MPNAPFTWGPTGPLALQPGGVARTNGQILNYDGAKNYLTNPLAETGTTIGWSLGTVTLTSNLPTGTPTFGSGASGNLSLTASSTTPLSGAYSFSYASSAATTAGNFWASDAYTIDQADLGKVINFAFSYKAFSNSSNANWSGTTSNSFAVAIYDVTAGGANWIVPVGVFNMIQGSGAGVCTGYFQSSVVSGQQYRFVVYNANATAGAITMQFDQMFNGPASQNQNGQPVVLEVGLTTGGTASANTVIKYDTVIVDTAGGYSTSTGLYTVPISGYYNISNVVLTNTAGTGIYVSLSGTQKQYISATPVINQLSAGATIIYANAGQTISLFTNTTSTFTSATAPAFFNSFSLSLIQAAGVGPAGQVVAMNAGVLSSTTVTAGTALKWTTVVKDTTGSYNSSTGQYTVPITGMYLIAVSPAFVSATASSLDVFKNGSADAAGFMSIAINTIVSGSIIRPYNAGDIITIVPQGSTTLSNTVGYLSIALWQGPSAANTSNAKVASRYTDTSGATVGTSFAIFKYQTKSFDYQSAYSTSTGLYTCQSSGLFSIKAVLTGVVGSNTGSGIAIYKNGVFYSATQTFWSSGVNYSTQVADLIECNAGDTLAIYGAATQSYTATTSPGNNFLDIQQVG